MAIKKKFPYRAALVACNGSCHANQETKCQYGCIGCGKCVENCKFDAIFLNENGVAQVIEENVSPVASVCGNVRRISFIFMHVIILLL